MQATFITLKNKTLNVTLSNYGARIVGLTIADKNGNPVDVAAGFATVDDYLKATSPYYGATIGRFANRINRGQFSLNGTSYQLPVNNGPNSLHGGSGFHAKVWEVIESGDEQAVMQLISPDGEDGYPGELYVKVTFTLEDSALLIAYEATSNRDTVVNLTNHAYFNLNGEGNGDILDHILTINANAYTPVNENLIPNGEIATVNGSPFDFREAQTIGARIESPHEQLVLARGYDHNYVLDKPQTGLLAFAAKATGNKTGIYLEVHTTEPGMQLYTGNFMNGTNIFKGGANDNFRTTFCLETQHFPDSPNQPAFPSTVLSAGAVFKSSSLYKLGVE